MNGSEFQFVWLSDPRLTAHALSPMPAMAVEHGCNPHPVGQSDCCGDLRCGFPGAAGTLNFDAKNVSAAQVRRLAGTLPHGSTPRLERLRGFGASLGGTLICLCSRIALADNKAGVLVVSTERAGKDLSLPERVSRTLADFGQPAAIFTADGELIDATPAARERFGAHRDLVALGSEKLARQASLNGKAEGDIAAGAIEMFKLGAGSTVTLLVVLEGRGR